MTANGHISVFRVSRQVSAYAPNRHLVVPADFRGGPGADSQVSLPPWLSISCATTGRTSRTGLNTMATGFGANAARARNVGTGWGLSVEKPATMLTTHSDVMAWLLTAGCTVTAVTGPSGANDGVRVSDNTGSVEYAYDPDGGATIGQSVCVSLWATNNQGGGTSGSCNGNLASGAGDTVPITYPIGAGWHRYSRTGTVFQTSSNISIIPCDLGTASETGSLDVAYPQLEMSTYATSVFPHSSAGATRAADVVSIATPSAIAPSGFLDLELEIAPNFVTTEHTADLTLLSLGSNLSAILRASDHAVALTVSGSTIATGALTWARNELIRIRILHDRSGRLVSVRTAAGLGEARGTSLAGVTLPGTAYLMSSSTGAEECTDLRFAAFSRPR